MLMDVKVYKKEAVRQPKGVDYVISPNIIDIYPDMIEDTTGVYLSGAEELNTESEVLDQACSLATIWQKGLDPIDTDLGVRWSEAMLGEINPVQLMEDITNAVAEVTPTVNVIFDTVIDAEGNSYLKYTINGVA